MRRVNITIVSFLTFFLLATVGGCKESAKSQSTPQSMPFVTTLLTADQTGLPTTTFTQGEPISFTATLTNTLKQIQWVWLSDCYTPPAKITILDTSGNTVTGVNLDVFSCCTLPTARATSGVSFSLSSNESFTWSTVFHQPLSVGSYKAVCSFIGFMTSGFSGGCPSNIPNYTALPISPSVPVSLIIK